MFNKIREPCGKNIYTDTHTYARSRKIHPNKTMYKPARRRPHFLIRLCAVRWVCYILYARKIHVADYDDDGRTVDRNMRQNCTAVSGVLA